MLRIKISSIWKFQPSLTPLDDPRDIIISGLLTLSGPWSRQSWPAVRDTGVDCSFALPSAVFSQVCLKRNDLWNHTSLWVAPSVLPKGPWPPGEDHQSSPSRGRHPHTVPVGQRRERQVLSMTQTLHFLPKRFFRWWVKIIPFTFVMSCFFSYLPVGEINWNAASWK